MTFSHTHEVGSLHFHFCSWWSEFRCKNYLPFPSMSINQSDVVFLGSQKPAEAMGNVTSSSYCFWGGDERSIVMPTPLIIFSLKLHFLFCPCKYEEQSHCYCLSYSLFLLEAESELLKTTYSYVLEAITFPVQRKKSL